MAVIRPFAAVSASLTGGETESGAPRTIMHPVVAAPDSRTSFCRSDCCTDRFDGEDEGSDRSYTGNEERYEESPEPRQRGEMTSHQTWFDAETRQVFQRTATSSGPTASTDKVLREGGCSSGSDLLIGAQGNRTSARSCTTTAAPGPTSSPVYGFPGAHVVNGAFAKENVAAKRKSQKDHKLGKGDAGRISEGHGHFAQKCRELQGFVRPLNLLLNGLRAGKYRKGLTSFQESVAMDRIQRILGVLQNPHLGERYMRILLQVETMLLSWFPSVAPVVSPDKDSMSEVTRCKRLKRVPAHGSLPALEREFPEMAATFTPSVSRRRSTEELIPISGGAVAAMHVKWIHTLSVCSPPQYLSTVGDGGNPSNKELRHSIFVMQDSVVSSSTDSQTECVHHELSAGPVSTVCTEHLTKIADPGICVSVLLHTDLFSRTDSQVTAKLTPSSAYSHEIIKRVQKTESTAIVDESEFVISKHNVKCS